MAVDNNVSHMGSDLIVLALSQDMVFLTLEVGWALWSPKGMTSDLYRPNRMKKAVFSLAEVFVEIYLSVPFSQIQGGQDLCSTNTIENLLRT